MEYDAVLLNVVDCAVNAIAIVLGKTPRLSSEGVLLVERLENREDLVINMGMCNAKWQGILTFGSSREDLALLIQDPSQNMALDALGEVLNTAAGMIAGMEDCRKYFGELYQSTPVILEGGTFYPKAHGAQADILLEDSSIRFGFSMRATGG